ncbi:hypothetical protein KBD71_03660 [Candidatus Woesebacteria bacterium]|nr:hypothetical protein [Candidatus Woesebacteria bacterium]
MSEQMGSYYVVPSEMVTEGGLHLEANTHLWIPGVLTADQFPAHLYGLSHSWDHMQPDESMQTMVPTIEDWLQIQVFIADGLFVSTTRDGNRQ